MHHYNTSRPPLVLRVYGRNLAKLVESLHQVPSIEERRARAKALIRLMQALNPNLPAHAEHVQNILWEQLFLIAGERLDVGPNIPLPPKKPLGLEAKPFGYLTRVSYPRQYGRLIVQLMGHVAKEANPDRQTELLSALFRLIRLITRKDRGLEVLLNDIQQITGKQLTANTDELRGDLSIKPPISAARRKYDHNKSIPTQKTKHI